MIRFPALFRTATLTLLLAVAFSASAAWAGDVLRFSGFIYDASGAAIPEAHVSILNQGTGQKMTIQSSAQGWYEFLAPAGIYQLEIAAPGFQSYKSDGLTLGPTAPLRHDAALSIASRAEIVEVNDANSTTVDTVTTQIGEGIEQKKMTSVPLNGRSYTDLLALQAGVIPISSAQTNAVVMSGATSTPPSGDLNPGDMSVSGQRETANGFLVNGSSVEEDFNNGSAVIPNLDSIAEFRVLTSGFDAEYGNFSGGQVIVTTKSGVNQLHGSAFEFARNTNLDATNYLAGERAAYDRNQFGGTLGGPVLRNKLFWFADYQGTRMTEGQETGNIAVPTASDREGMLSDEASSLTGTVSGDYLASILTTRLGYTVSTGESYYTTGCTSSSACVFPNATIPTAAWSAPSKNLLQYIPSPNAGTNTFSSASYNETLNDDKAALRLDWTTHFGDFSGYYFRDGYVLDNPYPTSQGGASVPGFDASSHGRAQLLNLGWTRAWGSTLVNELHVSVLRDSNVIGQPVGGVGPTLSSQGFVEGEGTLGIVAMNPSVEGIENVSLNDFTFGVDTTGERQANNTYQITENLSKVLGKHTFKFGTSLHKDQVNILSNSINNGAFVFQGSETGLDFADFLIGVASTYEQGDAAGFYLRNQYAGIYAQDSWQVRNNLTLNYGVRWDMLPPWHEKYNQLQTFVLGQQSEVYPNAPAGIVFPGDKGIANTLSPTKWTNFSPRIGVAYSPSWNRGLLSHVFGAPGKSSIHAGYGIFYTAFEGLSAGIMSACAPYGYDYDSTSGRPLFDEPFVSASTGATNGQPFPSPIPAYGASVSHPNSSVDWSKYEPITGDPAFYYQNQSPYTESYNLSLERELYTGTVLTLGYVGSQAHHLLDLIPANPGNATKCLSVSETNQVAAGSSTCGPFDEGGSFTKADGTTVVARGPFGPLFDGITYQKTIGYSHYNALEATLKHQDRHVELLAAYTYSKSIDNASSLSEEINPIEPSISRAVSAFDVTHNFVISYHINLPVEDVFHRTNRWTKGWTLSGITRFSSGMPVTLFNNDDTSLIGSMPNGINNNGVDTPTYAGGALKLNKNPRNGRKAFDTTQFSIPNSSEYGTIGNARRRFFYGPGLENYDMAMEKSVNFGVHALTLRLESFNVFNHAQFFGPNAVQGNPDSSNFGKFVNANDPREMQMAVKYSF
ncbi:carboxypeptidase regulatory-like domain-containing protein [Telmatobacter bradus]|uniref:TonB-dependent receptor n=1 Tax=Telmatobacter bradus TaxID=474953 RepID=UPI003B437A24